MSDNLQPGDRISFDAEGIQRTPYGFGIVTRVLPNGNVLIQPDFPIAPGLKMTNIKKHGLAVRKAFTIG